MHLTKDAITSLLELHYHRREALIEFSASLPQDELSRPVASAWGSYLGILRHCLATEEFWLRSVMAGKPAPDIEAESLAQLRYEAARVKESTWAQLQASSQADLERRISVEAPVPFTGTPGEIYAHVFTHDFYHRGQCLLLAQQMGHDVPDLDVIQSES